MNRNSRLRRSAGVSRRLSVACSQSMHASEGAPLVGFSRPRDLALASSNSAYGSARCSGRLVDAKRTPALIVIRPSVAGHSVPLPWLPRYSLSLSSLSDSNALIAASTKSNAYRVWQSITRSSPPTTSGRIGMTSSPSSFGAEVAVALESTDHFATTRWMPA